MTAVEFLQTSHLLEFISWGDVIVNLFIKNRCFLQKLEKLLIEKNDNKSNANYASTTNLINIFVGEIKKKKKFEVLIITVATESSLCLTPYRAKG